MANVQKINHFIHVPISQTFGPYIEHKGVEYQQLLNSTLMVINSVSSKFGLESLVGFQRILQKVIYIKH